MAADAGMALAMTAAVTAEARTSFLLS